MGGRKIYKCVEIAGIAARITVSAIDSVAS
jgi:hypothetical protein